ncbi:MAG: DNA starvation/stationary phase protection protein [Candidatus Ancillula sp.]|jgi:starvation-inducible DNA-binding protein|nr:DNA starvation/stationary phase protection protein [Candidatus Ancillula sp.]
MGIPTLTDRQTDTAVQNLQLVVDILNDLALTLKHAHWNVTGPNFIAVHEMLDPQIEKVRESVDTAAERIAALGGSPNGLSSSVLKVAKENLPQYTLTNKAETLKHLKALDEQYTAIETILRAVIEELDSADLISSNIVQDFLLDLEQFQWFIRSHIA